MYVYVFICIYIYIHILTPLPCTSKHQTLLGWGKEQAAVYLHREAHRGGMILEDPSSEWTEWTGEVFLLDRDLCIVFSIFMGWYFNGWYLSYFWFLVFTFQHFYGMINWCSSFQKLVFLGLFLGFATTMPRELFGCSCYHQLIPGDLTRHTCNHDFLW